MAKRLLTSAIGIIIFFCVLPAPPSVFSAAVLIITLGAIFELHRAVIKDIPILITGLLSSLLIFFGMISDNLSFGIFAVFSIYLILSVVTYGKEKVWIIYMLGFATVIFSCFLSTLAKLRISFSVYETLLPFLFAWITDSGAYFVGKTMGKHKLAPNLSPKKTAEGSLGGIITCILASLLYVWILDFFFSYSILESSNYIFIAVTALTVSIVSQFGDLALSAIKRDFGIKDYGNILPGHGGILDRFDSVLFAAPVVYFILYFMQI